MIGEFQDNALTKEWLYYWKNNRIFERPESADKKRSGCSTGKKRITETSGN